MIDFWKDITPHKRSPEEVSKIEDILTASLRTEPGLDKLATEMIGRYKRLIFGYKCNNCGSDEIYRQGAVLWGPHGGYFACGKCNQTADLYQSVARRMMKVVQINDDGTETPIEQTANYKQSFTSNPGDMNSGTTLRRWRQTSSNPETWEECEVPLEERPTKKVWDKYHKEKS